MQDGVPEYYAIDVAFHENGLSYGDKETTALKVASKCVRTALCLYGYMGTTRAELIFASPKIHVGLLELLDTHIATINRVFHDESYDFHVRLICNHEFQKVVLEPILLVSDDVADTSELFMRAYQMYSMFADSAVAPERSVTRSRKASADTPAVIEANKDVSYAELKVGKLANVVLREMLQSGKASPREIDLMLEKDYSKRVFDLQYPVLVRENSAFDRVRYYSNPLMIDRKKYYLCSQWFETSANNDRPYLEKWIAAHE